MRPFNVIIIREPIRLLHWSALLRAREYAIEQFRITYSFARSQVETCCNRIGLRTPMTMKARSISRTNDFALSGIFILQSSVNIMMYNFFKSKNKKKKIKPQTTQRSNNNFRRMNNKLWNFYRHPIRDNK